MFLYRTNTDLQISADQEHAVGKFSFFFLYFRFRSNIVPQNLIYITSIWVFISFLPVLALCVKLYKQWSYGCWCDTSWHVTQSVCVSHCSNRKCECNRTIVKVLFHFLFLEINTIKKFWFWLIVDKQIWNDCKLYELSFWLLLYL